MALTYLTAAQANAGILAMFTTSGSTYYASLHSATPSSTGTAEITGYTRQSVLWGAPSSGVELSTDAQNWTSMPAVTVSYFGFWTASTSGTWLGGGILGSSLTVPSGATVSAAVGAISVTVAG